MLSFILNYAICILLSVKVLNTEHIQYLTQKIVLQQLIPFKDK